MNFNIKRLPDGEFSIMKIIWGLNPPITTHDISQSSNFDVNLKPQTVLTILARLTEKGFLTSERKGKERLYTPIISEKEYLDIETGDFLHRYSGNSMGSLIKTLCNESKLTKQDLDDLKIWFSKKE
ncbi:transcriptional regulator, BlaI/MecI/CopY family [Peptoanaerobacter stomatis]|uniref:Transcriptional regulator, BlaI/MecI/CopY family n=1 Tax=Peptoanaerobacter stomatis TaxID=796937 RepID=J5W7U4_9FIRM|nr:BlaI/MecI/CopY family transcriptional regulator [Peptoanaerobacter stomatis]EJU19997.1 transcriptional regulator, BlaI/MecI/CopY family [Peptoanaerobacter stomatis]NWO25025.1 BlaI/MecI/CopY family transcriptional regulator [Peptostreptococcaceae bacterium oral taxon 081]